MNAAILLWSCRFIVCRAGKMWASRCTTVQKLCSSGRQSDHRCFGNTYGYWRLTDQATVLRRSNKNTASRNIAQHLNHDDLHRAIASEKLENSYAGVLGHVIEPVIRPLGFDWKIGIALITSFAAREVFVGTMATIYSVEGDAEKMESVQQKMHTAKNPRQASPCLRSLWLFR